MMKKKLFSLLFTLNLFLSGAFAASLNTGAWRFELKAVHGTIPFIITFSQKNNTISGVLHNGKEKITLTDITLKNKKLSIPLQVYEVTLEMDLDHKNRMNGVLVRHNKNPKIETPVVAVFGQKERFPHKKDSPSIDLNGKWSVTLTDQEDKKSPGVITFEQKGNTLFGSIMTPTGDHRYMEGYVSHDEFEAASFDGVYNYLLKGKFKKNKLEARILSNSITKVDGVKDEKATLPDAYKQTEVTSLNFSFPDLDGKSHSLSDSKFKDRPVIVQIFGSWCPNCQDEMDFLIPWYNQNKKRGIEIVALAFERSLDAPSAKKQLLKVQKKKNVPYPLLIAGTTTLDKPVDKLPGLKNFISFPTTIFLNRKHEVVKVHAGFTGPGTGEFFEKWKTEFNQTVDELLK